MSVRQIDGTAPDGFASSNGATPLRGVGSAPDGCFKITCCNSAICRDAKIFASPAGWGSSRMATTRHSHPAVDAKIFAKSRTCASVEVLNFIFLKIFILTIPYYGES